MVTWDPAQYLHFTDHRLRPALDLLSRIGHTSPELVHDVDELRLVEHLEVARAR